MGIYTAAAAEAAAAVVTEGSSGGSQHRVALAHSRNLTSSLLKAKLSQQQMVPSYALAGCHSYLLVVAGTAHDTQSMACHQSMQPPQLTLAS